MKNNTALSKGTALVLTLSLTMGLLTGCGGASTKETVVPTDAPSDNIAAITTATGDRLVKDETVYVLSSPTGSTGKIIVSDWLKNGTKEDTITDRTTLSNPTVTKGDTTSQSSSDGTTLWNAKGVDVHYQGTSTQTLPVEMTVSYTLNGKPISPDELKGQSGKVTIRYSFTNNQSGYGTVDGVETKLYVPFTVVTGTILDNNIFSDVTVTDGKAVDLGDKTAVMGIALPGMKENLGVEEDTLHIPTSMEISATVTNFSMGNTMSLCTNEAFQNLDFSDEDVWNKLTGSMDSLASAVLQLSDGSAALYDNLSVLLEKSITLTGAIGQIADVTQQLSDGAVSISDGAQSLSGYIADLKSGLQQLASKNDQLTTGAKSVFQTFIDTANGQIAAANFSNLGITPPTLTLDNYDTALTGLISALGEENVRAIAHNKALTAVTEGVHQQENAVYTAAAAAGVKQQLMTLQHMSSADADAYLLTDAGKALVANAMAGMTPEQKKLAIQTAIDQQMADPAITAQVDAAIAMAAAGRTQLTDALTQLEQYNVFYTGLLEYTQGVATAESAAGQISVGAVDLCGYIKTLSDGLIRLAGGAGELKQQAAPLPDGVTRLRDGAKLMSDGLNQLNKDGMQKIIDFVKGDLSTYRSRLQAISHVSEGYTNFSGIAPNMEGRVKFITKVDEISAE